MSEKALISKLDSLNEHELRRLLADHLSRQKLGLVWERDAIEHDKALNANAVMPRLVQAWSHALDAGQTSPNLIIEGDNFDSLRLLRATHTNKIRVIYIDPPYNTGSGDFVYNDTFVGKNDRWRHSQWLEFLYQRLTLARDLLTPDGVIMVSINDANRSRLEMLMDTVFPGMRLGSLVWRTRDSTSAKGANFSDVHEHVLIYAGHGFTFIGREKLPTKYKNPDNDPDGPWNGDPLTLAFDRFDRENLFYPLHNPNTNVWYPCDENRVWAYATKYRVKDINSLAAETMESFIQKGRILFPDAAKQPLSGTKKQLETWQESSKVVVWSSLEELLYAIDNGEVPVTPKRKRPLLTRNTPDLEFWIGKKVGFGRPLFKKHWKFLRSHVNPLSSWVARLGEEEDEDTCSLRSPQAGEGTEIIQAIFGSKAFQFPKPLMLVRELISQTARPGDIVLDFFAGSGTTGHAVLELNAEDGGQRRFILCSSTEATEREPDKNLCRNVCAERMRRVMQGYADKPGFTREQGGSFAYLQIDKIEPGDLEAEFAHEHAQQLLSLRHAHAGRCATDDAIQVIDEDAESALVYLHHVDAKTVKALTELPQTKLSVYSSRAQTVAEKLEHSGKVGNSYSIVDELTHGQLTGERT